MTINYPRKCEHCEYLSNNPQMNSYHKRTHITIPDNKTCDHGCGNLAKFCGTGGKYTCEKIAHHCPEYIRKHSVRVSKQWENAEQRREATRISFVSRLHNQETVDKMKATKKKKTGIITPADAKNYRSYARIIRQRAQTWAKEQGINLGQQTLHVDHKLSILDAWHAGLSADVVNHPANLQILEAKQNSSKGSKSILTAEELLKLTESSNQLNNSTFSSFIC